MQKVNDGGNENERKEAARTRFGVTVRVSKCSEQ